MHRPIRFLALAGLALAALHALATPPMKEPKTGIEFPGETVFNGERYRVALTSNIPTRVLGIATWAAAVGYYVDAGVDTRGEVRSLAVESSAGKLLVLAFVRPVPAPSLRDLLRPALVARAGAADGDAYRRDVDKLLFAIDDMKRGEVIQFVWLPSGELEMLVKNATRARVRNAALAHALWEILLPPA